MPAVSALLIAAILPQGARSPRLDVSPVSPAPPSPCIHLSFVVFSEGFKNDLIHSHLYVGATVPRTLRFPKPCASSRLRLQRHRSGRCSRCSRCSGLQPPQAFKILNHELLAAVPSQTAATSGMAVGHCPNRASRAGSLEVPETTLKTTVSLL